MQLLRNMAQLQLIHGYLVSSTRESADLMSAFTLKANKSIAWELA